MSSVATPIAADAAPSAIPHVRHGFGATDVGLIVMSVIWGVNYSVVKVGLRAVDPIVFAALRCLLAAVVLLGIAAAVRGVRWPSRRDMVTLCILGLIGNGFYQLLFLAGMSRTRAGIAALLVAAGPAWIAIISRVLGRERLPTRGWLGIIAQMVGVVCVVGSTSGGDTGGNAMLGAALIAVGSITWAIFTVFLQPFTMRVHSLHLSGITMASGAAFCLAVAVPGMLRTDWGAIPFNAWGAMVYASLGAMVIAYMLYYHGIRMIGATKTAVYSNLQPLIALAVASLMLGERPTGWQLLGAAFIMGGLLMSRMARVTPVAARSPIPDRS